MTIAWFARWIVTTAMLSVVAIVFTHHWFVEFLLFFAVLLFMNRGKLRPH